MRARAVAASDATVSAYAHLVNPNRHWYNNKRIVSLNLWILLLLITSSATAYDGNIMNSLQSLPQWTQYFNNPGGRKLDLLNTMQSIGSLAAFPISPYIADGLGRRTSIFIGALIMCVASAVQTSAISIGMFMGARFLIGFGLTFAATAAPILIAEIAYPAYHAPLTSSYNSLWYSGAIVAAWSTFGAAKIQTTWSWRLPSILQVIPSVLQMAFIFLGPESPRWLISKNRNAEALKTLAYYHADSNEGDLLVKFEYDEIKADIDLSIREVDARVGWKGLFTNSRNKKRMTMLLLLAFSTQWCAYSLNKTLDSIGITDSNNQLLITSILQIWNLFWALFTSSLVDKVGRRILFLTSTAGMVVFFSLQTALSTFYTKTGNQAAAYAVIPSIFLFYTFYDIAFPPLMVSYSVEMFPYSLRAKGFAFFNFAVSISFIINKHLRNPFTNLGAMSWKYSIVYVVMLLFQGVLLWFFVVETKNCTLEEAAAQFDGGGVIEQLVSATRNGTEDGEKTTTAVPG